MKPSLSYLRRKVWIWELTTYRTYVLEGEELLWGCLCAEGELWYASLLKWRKLENMERQVWCWSKPAYCSSFLAQSLASASMCPPTSLCCPCVQQYSTVHFLLPRHITSRQGFGLSQKGENPLKSGRLELAEVLKTNMMLFSWYSWLVEENFFETLVKLRHLVFSETYWLWPEKSVLVQGNASILFFCLHHYYKNLCANRMGKFLSSH